MHPEKSKIVYCQDSNRTESYPNVQFTFLALHFGQGRHEQAAPAIFTSFLPGVSSDAVKRMRKVVRGWRIPRQTPATLAELAEQYNSVIRGWWEYYGAFYQTAMRNEGALPGLEEKPRSPVRLLRPGQPLPTPQTAGHPGGVVSLESAGNALSGQQTTTQRTKSPHRKQNSDDKPSTAVKSRPCSELP
jgi:hypothetical protein